MSSLSKCQQYFSAEVPDREARKQAALARPAIRYCGGGLAAGSPGRHRGRTGGPAPAPGRDRHVRPVLVLGGGDALRAGRPRLLPGRKKGREQIECGLLTDPEGRSVAIRVFADNTAEPAAFTQAVDVVRTKVGLDDLVMAGDRGMITTARIRAPKQAGGLSWITCLRALAIRKLADDGGPLQMSLFDQQDLAEITSPDYLGERLIACRNPLLAAERARKRENLLAATDKLLGKSARPGHRRTAEGRGQDRRARREGHRPVQGRQALHPRHQPRLPRMAA